MTLTYNDLLWGRDAVTSLSPGSGPEWGLYRHEPPRLSRFSYLLLQRAARGWHSSAERSGVTTAGITQDLKADTLRRKTAHSVGENTYESHIL